MVVMMSKIHRMMRSIICCIFAVSLLTAVQLFSCGFYHLVRLYLAKGLPNQGKNQWQTAVGQLHLPESLKLPVSTTDISEADSEKSLAQLSSVSTSLKSQAVEPTAWPIRLLSFNYVL